MSDPVLQKFKWKEKYNIKESKPQDSTAALDVRPLAGLPWLSLLLPELALNLQLPKYKPRAFVLMADTSDYKTLFSN